MLRTQKELIEGKNGHERGAVIRSPYNLNIHGILSCFSLKAFMVHRRSHEYRLLVQCAI